MIIYIASLSDARQTELLEQSLASLPKSTFSGDGDGMATRSRNGKGLVTEIAVGCSSFNDQFHLPRGVTRKKVIEGGFEFDYAGHSYIVVNSGFVIYGEMERHRTF